MTLMPAHAPHMRAGLLTQSPSSRDWWLRQCDRTHDWVSSLKKKPCEVRSLTTACSETGTKFGSKPRSDKTSLQHEHDFLAAHGKFLGPRTLFGHTDLILIPVCGFMSRELPDTGYTPLFVIIDDQLQWSWFHSVWIMVWIGTLRPDKRPPHFGLPLLVLTCSHWGQFRDGQLAHWIFPIHAKWWPVCGSQGTVHWISSCARPGLCWTVWVVDKTISKHFLSCKSIGPLLFHLLSSDFFVESQEMAADIPGEGEPWMEQPPTCNEVAAAVTLCAQGDIKLTHRYPVDSLKNNMVCTHWFGWFSGRWPAPVASWCPTRGTLWSPEWTSSPFHSPFSPSLQSSTDKELSPSSPFQRTGCICTQLDSRHPWFLIKIHFVLKVQCNPSAFSRKMVRVLSCDWPLDRRTRDRTEFSPTGSRRH